MIEPVHYFARTEPKLNLHLLVCGFRKRTHFFPATTRHIHNTSRRLPILAHIIAMINFMKVDRPDHGVSNEHSVLVCNTPHLAATASGRASPTSASGPSHIRIGTFPHGSEGVPLLRRHYQIYREKGHQYGCTWPHARRISTLNVWEGESGGGVAFGGVFLVTSLLRRQR